MMSPVQSFIFGLSSPLGGLKLIFSSKRKFLLSIIPFFLGLIVLTSGFYWAYSFLGGAVESWLNQFEALSGVLLTVITFLVAIFSWVAFFTVAFIGCYIFISIVGGPFYSMLVEDVFRTESREGLIGGTGRLILKMLFLSIMKVVLFTVVGAVCFILSFIPILNIFSTYVVFMVIAFDCSDYAFEVEYKTLRERLSFVLRNFWAYSGLTTAILATSLLPGSFFLLLPAFICGATKMYIQLEDKSI